MTRESRLGKRILRHRKEAQMSQSELASGLCSRPYLSRLERGLQLPSPALLADICDRLEVSMPSMADIYLREPGVGPKARLRTARILADRGAESRAWTVLHETRGLLSEQEKEDKYEDELDHTLVHLLRLCGKYTKALHICQRLLQRRRRRPSERLRLTQAHYLLGDTAYRCGHHNLARDQLFRAFNCVMGLHPERAPESRDRVWKLHREVVDALVRVLLHLRSFEAADSVLRLASLRWRELSLPGGIPEALRMQMGSVKIGTGDLHEAEHILQELARSESTESEEYGAQVFCGLGLIHRLRGETEEAVISLLSAWEQRDNCTPEVAITAAHQIAHCYIATGDLQEADGWVRQAAGIVAHGETTPDPDLALENMLLQVELARRMGRHPPRPAERMIEDIRASDAKRKMRCATLVSCIRLALKRGDDDAAHDALRLIDDLLSVPGIGI